MSSTERSRRRRARLGAHATKHATKLAETKAAAALVEAQTEISRLHQEIARLEAELRSHPTVDVEAEVTAEIERRVDAEMPKYRQVYQTALEVKAMHDGLYTAAEYRAILAALHEDQFTDEANKQRARRAFQLIREKKDVLCQRPPKPQPPPLWMPKTREDWAEARARVRRKNSERAKEAARKRKTKGRRIEGRSSSINEP